MNPAALDLAQEVIREYENLEDCAPVSHECLECSMGTSRQDRTCAYHMAKAIIADAARGVQFMKCDSCGKFMYADGCLRCAAGVRGNGKASPMQDYVVPLRVTTYETVQAKSTYNAFKIAVQKFSWREETRSCRLYGPRNIQTITRQVKP